MTYPDVSALLAQGMGPRLHWFPADVPVTRLATVMVGFANTDGGTILLGVAPRSAHVLGLPDLEQARDTVFQAALLIDPPLVLPVPQIAPAGGEQVLVLNIPAGLANVYNLEGRYLGREGTQTNPLPARSLRQLLMERGVVHFERQSPPEACLDDLDFEKAGEYLQRLHLSASESTPEALLRRGCLRRLQKDRYVPTYAGLLLFGKDPQQWLPNATMLMARYAGRSAADSFIKQELRGALPDQLAQAEVFIRDQMRSQVRLVGLAHQEMPEYPLEAVRELLVNAVAHRDYNLQGDSIRIHMYSDRMEIHSPGGLPGPVNLDNLLEARFSRNPVVMQLLADLGYVERLGYGLNRVVDVLRKNQQRLPLFEDVSGTFRVTLYPAEQALLGDKSAQRLSALRELELNPRQEQAVQFLFHHRRITNRDFQDLCPEVHPETLRRDLADLVEKNVLIKIGDKRATYYVLKSA